MLPLELKAIQMAGQGVRKGRPDYAYPLGIQQAKNDQDDPWDQNFHVNAMQTVASPETALYREHDSKEQKSLKTNCEGVACAFVSTACQQLAPGKNESSEGADHKRE
jgi:hypothetical protein